MAYNYKMTICYDGSKYLGWQRLSNHPNDTIQGKLEHVLSLLFEESIEVVGSGRTDKGVHAKAQVCHFHAKEKKDINTILNYLAIYLPKDIAVISITVASPRFHARYNALKKRYCYTVENALFANPFTAKYALHVPESISISDIEKAAAYLLGTHDFKAFTSMKSKKKSTIRTIHSIDIQKSNNTISIIFTGNGFLQHMVRILTGTLLEVGMGKRTPDSIKTILESKDRSNAGPTVPSHGLCMEEVYY